MNPEERPLSVGEFLLMLFLSGIPVVGFILLLVWAFGGAVNQNRKNFARATLILSIIGFVLAIAFSSVLMTIVSSVANSL